LFAGTIVLLTNINWSFATTAHPNQLPMLVKVFVTHLQYVWFFRQIQKYTTNDFIVFDVIMYI
jgi:hypothetical protein